VSGEPGFDLQGRTALVIGGTSGIGREIALGFQAAGARVFVASSSAEKVERAQRELQQRDGSARGFVADVREQSARPHGSDLFHDVEPEDLIKYGLIPEFVGRLPVVATLDELDEAALVQILTEPRNALTKQYRKLFEMEQVLLKFTDGALEAIAEEAIRRKTGARGLRSIMEGILLDPMYELPALEVVEEMVINREFVEGRAKPLSIYAYRRDGVGSSA